MGNSMSSAHQTVGMCALDRLSTSPNAALQTSLACSLVHSTPAPQGTVCGFTGFLSLPDVLADYPIDGGDLSPQITCTRACWDSLSCRTSSYDLFSRKCLHYGSAVTKMRPKKSSFGPRFFETDCFYQLCELDELVTRNETASHLDFPAAELKLKHCGLDETVFLTDPAVEYDEHTFFPISLPFPVHLYGASTDSLYMSINGFISFHSPFITRSEPHALPHFTAKAKGSAFSSMVPSVEGGLPENSLCALWTEAEVTNKLTSARSESSRFLSHKTSIAQQTLARQILAANVMNQAPALMKSRLFPKALDSGLRKRSNMAEIDPALPFEAAPGWTQERLPHQGMMYAVTGQMGSRLVTFTWKTSRKGDPGDMLDFDLVYQEDFPGQWITHYRQVGTTESSLGSRAAIVGAQSTEASGLFFQYLQDTLPVSEGFTLIFKSKTNELRRSRTTAKSKLGLTNR